MPAAKKALFAGLIQRFDRKTSNGSGLKPHPRRPGVRLQTLTIGQNGGGKGEFLCPIP